jgi:hypothetical protein
MTTRSEVSGNGILREVGRCQRENVNRELDVVETRCYRKVRYKDEWTKSSEE